MHRTCCIPTKKGKTCPFNADRCRDGLWYCHVHDPWGNFQVNVQHARLPLFFPQTQPKHRAVARPQPTGIPTAKLPPLPPPLVEWDGVSPPFGTE